MRHRAVQHEVPHFQPALFGTTIEREAALAPQLGKAATASVLRQHEARSALVLLRRRQAACGRECAFRRPISVGAIEVPRHADLGKRRGVLR